MAVLLSLEVEKAVLVAGLGLTTKGGRHFVLRSAEDETSTGELDARFSSCARLSVGDVTCRSEWTFLSSRQRRRAKFTISGFRTGRWLCQFVRDQDHDLCALEGGSGSVSDARRSWITNSVHGCYSVQWFLTNST